MKEIKILPIFEDDDKMYISNEDAEKFFDLLNKEENK